MIPPNINQGNNQQQHLWPKAVADHKELAKGIADKAQSFLRNSTGVTGVTQVKKNYFMATDSRGHFYLSTRSFTDPKMGTFSPHQNLKDAWNKLAAGKPLIWQEEYAVESLWHEIVHNRQKIAYTGGQNNVLTRTMEIVTQWTARRTYPEFLQSMGASPAHLESIKQDGLGYGLSIKNFDRLLAALKIDETALLTEMQRIIDTAGRNKYLEELTEFLSRQSGAGKSAIRLAMSRTNKSRYEAELRKLRLIT
jgi:hypothetical protein